jgi:predicted DNA-binding transcriptional regulator AlpA
MTETTALPQERAAMLDPGTYCAGDIAELVQYSMSHVWRLPDAGKMPSCLRVSRLVRWPRKLINVWIAEDFKTVRHAGGYGHEQ